MSKVALTLIVIAGIIATLTLINFSSRKNVNENMEETQIPQSKTPLLIKGSIPYWDQTKAFESFKNNVESFDYISIFWHYLMPDGKIAKYKAAKEDKQIIDFAHANNVKILLVVTNLPDFDGATWDSKRVESAIKDEETTKFHIEQISAKIEEFNFDGVIIDYEQVDTNQKNNFSNFIKALSQELHKKDKIVAVALHPKSGEFKPNENNGSRSQDWKILAKYADQLYIMAYGEHWDEGEPGPIASYGWVENIVNYTKKLKVEGSKFYLGLPVYGYKWKVDSEETAEGLTYQQVQKITKDHKITTQWDEDAKSPFFEYEENGEKFVVWYENAQSVTLKIELAEKAGFGGVNFWRLGGEDTDLWQKVRELKSKTTP